MFPKKYSKEQIILKLEAYCAYQERSLFEIEKKLASLNSSPSDLTSILNHLKECNFFNQERFAISYAIGKFRNNKWGKDPKKQPKQTATENKTEPKVEKEVKKKEVEK